MESKTEKGAMKTMYQVERHVVGIKGAPKLLECKNHRTPDAKEVTVEDSANCWWCLNYYRIRAKPEIVQEGVGTS